MEQLPRCDFAAAKREYYDAHLAVQACLSGLWSGYRVRASPRSRPTSI
jgi:hypothetical protein